MVDLRTPFASPALSIEDQCSRVIDRGLICDEPELHTLLSRISYYRLSGYLWWFRESPEDDSIRSGTTLAEVMRLYHFDLKLRCLMMEAVHVIEVWFRSRFTNCLSETYGSMAYVEPAYFANPNALANDKAKLAERLFPTSEPFIDAFFEKHNDPFPPMWMSAEVMSLGLLSKWFDNLRVDSLRNQIASPTGLHPDVLASYLRQLTVIRNACAHHNRLWNRRFRVGVKIARRADSELTQALDGSDELRIFRALVYTMYLLKRLAPQLDVAQRLRDHIVSGDDEWIDEMDAPRDFENDALWAVAPH